LDKDNKPVRPSFYSDNFYSLLPGETRHIRIETSIQHLAGEDNTIIVKGYNVLPSIIHVNKIKGYEK